MAGAFPIDAMLIQLFIYRQLCRLHVILPACFQASTSHPIAVPVTPFHGGISMGRKGLIILWLESATAYWYLEEGRCPGEIYRHLGRITTRRGLKHLTNYPVFGLSRDTTSTNPHHLVQPRQYWPRISKEVPKPERKRVVWRLQSAAGLAKSKRVKK